MCGITTVFLVQNYGIEDSKKLIKVSTHGL